MSSIELMVVVAGLAVGFLVVSAFLGRRDRDGARQTQADTEVQNSTHNGHHASSEQHGAGDSTTVSQFRIFQCPHCSLRMRVQLPLIGRNSQCKKCGTRFVIGLDDHGNLHVISDTNSGQHPHDAGYDVPRTSEECLAILGLGPIATSEEIKAAYRMRIKEYHPDKVAHLGEKLRTVATREAQRLNLAYGFLKEKGFLKDA